MVFSSVPLYLDPYNWQQRSHQQQLGGDHGNSSHNPQIPHPPTPASQVGGLAGSIRPGSMADRARLAKLPQPEPGLKCPRCESTNTKFCYFNNYNLSQPRHFCKTCRRYWTRGGALRNVPVGGGCRRNKRSSKSSTSSKSQATNNDLRTSQNISATTTPISSSGNNSGLGFPLLSSLQSLNTQFSSGSNLGLSFGGVIQPQIGTTGGTSSRSELGFHVGSTNNYPNFLAGFEPTSSGLYPFQTDQNVEAPLPSSSILGETHQIRSVPFNTEDQNQKAPVKAEETLSQGFNLLSRPFLGIAENNQYWDGNNNNAWPDFSGINSSSNSQNLL